MNKIVALGMAALGASGIQVVSAQPLSAPPQKPWSVAATLRGFYDDNVNTATGDPGNPKIDTLGYELSPSVGVNWMNDATTIKAGYRYSIKYYDHNPDPARDKKYDQNHIFDASLTHAMNDRNRISVSDSFVIGQEPDVLRDPSNPSQRVNGGNVRNIGNIVYNTQFTRLFGMEFGYVNSFYDYEDHGGGVGAPSNSGLLDRVENRAYAEGQWQVTPQTKGILGYQYGQVNFTADEAIGVYPISGPPGLAVKNSDYRDTHSHYIYVGADHNFRPDFSGSLRVGFQYTQFPNIPSASLDDDSGTSPYVQAALNYTYAPESYVRAGFTQSRNPSYNSQANDADISVIFASWYHRIIPRLYGNVVGTFQNTSFNGGFSDGDSDQYFQAGVNLMYRFTSYLSGEIGYNYDKSNSSSTSNVDYTRNRVYIGVTASY